MADRQKRQLESLDKLQSSLDAMKRRSCFCSHICSTLLPPFFIAMHRFNKGNPICIFAFSSPHTAHLLEGASNAIYLERLQFYYSHSRTKQGGRQCRRDSSWYRVGHFREGDHCCFPEPFGRARKGQVAENQPHHRCKGARSSGAGGVCRSRRRWRGTKERRKKGGSVEVGAG